MFFWRLIILTSKKKKLTTPEIYQILREKITNFELYPGTRFTESELAEKFDVSRTPIREALKRLEVEGLVQIRPKQGCFVRTVDLETINNYYDVRVALETMAVELACSHMDSDKVEALCDFWDPKNFVFKSNYAEQVRQMEENFHLQIAEGSGNPVLVQLLHDVNDHIRIIRQLGFPDKHSVQETYEDHFLISNLILAKKTSSAKKTMKEHIRKHQKIASTVTLNQLEQHKKHLKL